MPLRRRKAAQKPANTENAKAENKESLADLQARAGTDYGIVNADQMSEAQLRSEMKAIDGQPATADKDSEPEE